MEWKTIDSAPKDGTPILILVEEPDQNVVTEAKYYEGSWDVVWLGVHGCGCCGGGGVTATHWMPKPPFP